MSENKNKVSSGKIILIFISILASIFILLASLLIIIKMFAPYIREADTIYTADYSKEKFSSIRRGMTKEEVLNILGEPFFIEQMGKWDNYPEYPVEYWQYTKQGKLGDPELNDIVGGNYCRVLFTRDRKVESTVCHVF